MRPFISVLSLMVAGALGACATAPAGPGATSSATSVECLRVDCDRMDRVAREASRRGVQLIWVNPPQRRDSPAATDG